MLFLLTAGLTINNPILGRNLQTLTGQGFLNGLISAMITLGFIIAVIVFFFMLLWGGYSWITSGGDKNQLQQAKDRLTNAMIGIIVLFSIYGIIGLLQTFFQTNLRLLNLPFFF